MGHPGKSKRKFPWVVSSRSVEGEREIRWRARNKEVVYMGGQQELGRGSVETKCIFFLESASMTLQKKSRK